MDWQRIGHRMPDLWRLRMPGAQERILVTSWELKKWQAATW
jgi:hypothetical protein